MSVLEAAAALLEAQPLCDPCLGRQFARLGHGLDNAERGRALRVALHLEGRAELGEPELCPLCLNHFAHVGRWAQRALAALEGVEFASYLVGTQAPAFLHEEEERLRARLGLEGGEPFKQAFNRAVGKRLGALCQAAFGRPVAVDFRAPDVLVRIDLVFENLSVKINPLYLYGRYRKLVRGLPQTHWPCARCRGRGCDACGGTGRQYPESVESLLGKPLKARCEAEEVVLHGAGREDIDARMLGAGRPCVLELKRPRRRFFDWAALEAEVNAAAAGKVELHGLTPVPPRAVAAVKTQPARKRYRAEVVLAAPVSEETFQEALRGLTGPVQQQTPRRVAHRRADRVRRREVFWIQGRLLEPRRAELELECAGGLYVKELVSGDEGRTRPSLSERLGVAARVAALDVLEVLGAFL